MYEVAAVLPARQRGSRVTRANVGVGPLPHRFVYDVVAMPRVPVAEGFGNLLHNVTLLPL